MKITLDLDEAKIKHLRELARWRDGRIESVLEAVLEEHVLQGLLEQGCPPAWSQLTSRQRQVARLACLRYTNKQIGRVLGISEHTVKTIMTSLMKKLGVTRRYHLIQ